MNEHEIRTLLTKATEDRPAGIDLMPALPRRRPPKILVPIATLAAAAVAAVAAVAIVLPATPSTAQAQVLAAVENTSQESYRIHTTSGAKTFDGAFDPVQRVGVIRRMDGVETRFIGDLMYGKESGEAKWTVAPRPDAELANAPLVVSVVKLAPLDPPATLQRLRTATDVRESGTASGQGWTGRRFTFSLEDTGGGNLKESPNGKITGTVDVDDQDRIRRMEFVFGGTGHRNVLDFSDFGAPVSVTAPPADQVQEAPAEKLGKPAKTN
ncbi:hypothetical protein ETD86_13140 [Nonomuraea turkmeniaca]|uniref:LppX_LprAFG lipoprotein n=1 Tax=Nonomuraea turkmeniaca TaxID=103838 RepID=A0A5S4FMK7_9ACTN|nr:hypothetical protein [Nonomuraea turkmeniaca]TMR21967.1 hypothetical protein ETD86_13140 [Nonomuraea turkmeniaca]